MVSHGLTASASETRLDCPTTPFIPISLTQEKHGQNLVEWCGNWTGNWEQNTDAFRVLLLFSGNWEQNWTNHTTLQHSKCLHNRKSGKWIRWKSDSQCFASQTPCCCLPAGIDLPRYGHLTLAHLAMDPGTGGINAAATVQLFDVFLRKLTNLLPFEWH